MSLKYKLKYKKINLYNLCICLIFEHSQFIFCYQYYNDPYLQYKPPYHKTKEKFTAVFTKQKPYFQSEECKDKKTTKNKQTNKQTFKRININVLSHLY